MRAEALLSDASPLVRAMAVWALAQLMPPEYVQFLRNTHERTEAGSGRASRMEPHVNHLLCFGFGFSARALAARLDRTGLENIRNQP